MSYRRFPQLVVCLLLAEWSCLMGGIALVTSAAEYPSPRPRPIPSPPQPPSNPPAGNPVPQPQPVPSSNPPAGNPVPQPQPVPSSNPPVREPVSHPQPLPSPSLSKPLPPQLSISVLEDAIYDLVNQHRLSLGLSPLIRVPQLSSVARQHSQKMAQRQVGFGHSNFTSRVRQVDRIISSRRVSENVAYIFTHQETAKRAVQGWLRSNRHRAALEGQYRFTGIGVAQGERGAFYFTQIYVQPR